mmetsp:Transcript_10115/g.61520  ORF Transcript_10115/g.61520 Transcript_10115/m.61520 type:complete len:129 (-) Transcript_10115:2172-2558(-)
MLLHLECVIWCSWIGTLLGRFSLDPGKRSLNVAPFHRLVASCNRGVGWIGNEREDDGNHCMQDMEEWTGTEEGRRNDRNGDQLAQKSNWCKSPPQRRSIPRTKETWNGWETSNVQSIEMCRQGMVVCG